VYFSKSILYSLSLPDRPQGTAKASSMGLRPAALMGIKTAVEAVLVRTPEGDPTGLMWETFGVVKGGRQRCSNVLGIREVSD